MKHLSWFVSVFILVCLLTSCDDPITVLQRRQEARAGVEASIAQLPKIAGFETIKVVYLEFSRTASGKTCYYARAYSIIGTSLAVAEALDVYTEKLQADRWVSAGKQYQTERALNRGINERTVVYSGDPGVDIKDAVDYERLGQTYQGLIFVSVDYIVPQREGC